MFNRTVVVDSAEIAGVQWAVGRTTIFSATGILPNAGDNVYISI